MSALYRAKAGGIECGRKHGELSLSTKWAQRCSVDNRLVIVPMGREAGSIDI